MKSFVGPNELYFFSFIERRQTLLPIDMSSDDVPLDDPLSASALLDVRNLTPFSLAAQEGKKKKTERAANERKRRTRKHQKF